MIDLPGPDRRYSLAVSLELIEELEAEYGSLYQLAQMLLDKTLAVSVLTGCLKKLYQAAGCETPEAFLLQMPCMDILSEVLVDILSPLEKQQEDPLAAFMAEMMEKFPDGDLSEE